MREWGSRERKELSWDSWSSIHLFEECIKTIIFLSLFQAIVLLFAVSRHQLTVQWTANRAYFPSDNCFSSSDTGSHASLHRHINAAVSVLSSKEYSSLHAHRKASPSSCRYERRRAVAATHTSFVDGVPALENLMHIYIYMNMWVNMRSSVHLFISHSPT